MLKDTRSKPLHRVRVPVRRRPENPDPQTAILDAAERLCGEHGIEAVSLRDIAQAAGVNLSALNYYFGSRTNLLVTILKTRTAELDVERQELLDEAGRRNPPELRDIVRAILLPLSLWRHPGSKRNAALQFITRSLTVAIPELKQPIDNGVVGFRPVIELLQRALPHLNREELNWRFHFMMSIEHMNVWDSNRLRILSDGLCNAEDHEEALERAVDFAVAGFLGPARRPTAGKRAGRNQTRGRVRQRK
jgi:AcrR family transcriptional regulator